MIVEEQRMGFWTGVRLPSGPLWESHILIFQTYRKIKMWLKNGFGFKKMWLKIR